MLEICIEAFPRAGLKLVHFILLASEGLHHLDGTEPFLRHGEHVAFALGDRGGLVADAFGVEINRQHHQRDDEQREQGDRRIEIPHRGEGGEEGNGALENKKALAVKGLDALRIVSDAETAIGAAALVVKLERQRMEIRVEFGAQSHEPVQANADGDKVHPIPDPAGQQMKRHHQEADQGDDRRECSTRPGRGRRARSRSACASRPGSTLSTMNASGHGRRILKQLATTVRTIATTVARRSGRK